MSKKVENTILPDPSELKEEILAKYPKKVAKKRDKSMVVNDPEVEQEVQSNVVITSYSIHYTKLYDTSSKNLLSRLRIPSQAVLLAGALSSPGRFSFPLIARSPSQISVIESQQQKMPKRTVINRNNFV